MRGCMHGRRLRTRRCRWRWGRCGLGHLRTKPFRADQFCLLPEWSSHPLPIRFQDLPIYHLEPPQTETITMSQQTTNKTKRGDILVFEVSPYPVAIPAVDSHSSFQRCIKINHNPNVHVLMPNAYEVLGSLNTPT